MARAKSQLPADESAPKSNHASDRQLAAWQAADSEFASLWQDLTRMEETGQPGTFAFSGWAIALWRKGCPRWLINEARSCGWTDDPKMPQRDRLGKLYFGAASVERLATGQAEPEPSSERRRLSGTFGDVLDDSAYVTELRRHYELEGRPVGMFSKAARAYQFRCGSCGQAFSSVWVGRHHTAPLCESCRRINHLAKSRENER